MSTCGRCSKQITRTETNKIVCKVCRISFHGTCSKLTVNEIEFLSSGNQWTCQACNRERRLSRGKSDSCPIINTDISLPAESMGVTLAEIEALLEKFKQEILDGQNKIEKQLNDSIEMCFNLIKENSQKMATQEATINAQQATIESLQGENKSLQSRVSELGKRLGELEQYSRKNTLEIFGIPESANESESTLMQTVIDVGKGLGVTLKEEGISACHRIPAANRSGKGIIVRFLRREDSDKLLAKRKVKRDFSTRHIPGRSDDNPVYINLSLSKERRILFAKARKLKEQFNYKYVWTDRNGRVKVKKDEGKKTKSVDDESELERIIQSETSKICLNDG